jgi:hypothetical protein
MNILCTNNLLPSDFQPFDFHLISIPSDFQPLKSNSYCWKAKSGGEVEAVLEAFFVGRPSPF